VTLSHKMLQGHCSHNIRLNSLYSES